MDLSTADTGLLLAVLVAISVGALLKGMTGLGLPLFAVPALALLTSVEDAVVVMIIPGIGANLWLVIKRREYRHLLYEHLPFLATGFIGGLVGSLLLIVVDERWLKAMLACWLGLYLIHYLLDGDSLEIFRGRHKVACALGLAAGTAQGATGLSAQIVAPYYHDRGLAPEGYAFVVAFTFLLFATAQISAVVNTALFTPARLQLGLLALVPALVFTRLGMRFAGRVSQLAFNQMLLVIFILMELKLIYDVV